MKKKLAKRILAVSLAASMTVPMLAGCGGDDGGVGGSAEVENTTEEEGAEIAEAVAIPQPFQAISRWEAGLPGMMALRPRWRDSMRSIPILRWSWYSPIPQPIISLCRRR